MRRQGPITWRHMVIAVLVMVVVNAQLTWWIIFAIGQSRKVLDLERDRLTEACRFEADRIRWAVASPSWDGRLPEAGDEVELGERGFDRGSRPEVVLPAPFETLVVRPRAEVWDELLAEHRRRIAMMVSEGSFFAVLLVVLIGLMWRTVRREVELERQHRNFLSAITHELKSPLAAIRLSLETVVRGRADESSSRRFIANALADTDRLEQLVTKVLEATRYGAGTTSIRLEEGCLSDVVERVVAAFEPRAAAAGAVLRPDVDPDVWVNVDPEAMAIAVSNLLENAVKYGGNPAEVDVVLRAVDGHAVIDVRDNGPGIPEAEIPFIFDRFYRAGDEMTRTSQGTGLGLYLVQRIVKAHHGRVVVASTGRGDTTFRVTVPEVEGGEDLS